MHVDWTCDGCDAEDERAIERLWEEDHWPAIEAKLAELPVEPAELRLAVCHHSEGEEWELQAALHLPRRTLTVEVASGSLEEVFDQFTSGMARRIDTVSEAPTEIRREHLGWEPLTALLKANHSAGRSRVFFEFLRPLARSLRTHARRELDILEVEGRLPGEEVETSDVLDELLLRAWDRFDERPGDVPLQAWLTGLVDQIVDDLARGEPLSSLEEEREVPLPEEDEQTSPHGWFESPTYPETVSLGELLPGHPGVDAWDRLDFAERQTQLTRMLALLSREERQTLVLNSVEDFEPEAIAGFQDRTVEDVRTDLENGRKILADALAQEVR